MKMIYIVVGEVEDTDKITVFEGAYYSQERADERCDDLKVERDDGYLYYTIPIPLEEEGDL